MSKVPIYYENPQGNIPVIFFTQSTGNSHVTFQHQESTFLSPEDYKFLLTQPAFVELQEQGIIRLTTPGQSLKPEQLISHDPSVAVEWIRECTDFAALKKAGQKETRPEVQEALRDRIDQLKAMLDEDFIPLPKGDIKTLSASDAIAVIKQKEPSDIEWLFDVYNNDPRTTVRQASEEKLIDFGALPKPKKTEKSDIRQTKNDN